MFGDYYATVNQLLINYPVAQVCCFKTVKGKYDLRVVLPDLWFAICCQMKVVSRASFSSVGGGVRGKRRLKGGVTCLSCVGSLIANDSESGRRCCSAEAVGTLISRGKQHQLAVSQSPTIYLLREPLQPIRPNKHASTPAKLSSPSPPSRSISYHAVRSSCNSIITLRKLVENNEGSQEPLRSENAPKHELHTVGTAMLV